MFDIRHKNVSRRECFWIAMAYLSVVLGLILLAFFFILPPVTGAESGPAGGARLDPASRWAFAPTRATVVKRFFACPLRNDLTIGASILIKHPDLLDRDAVNAYLGDHGCIVLHPSLQVHVRAMIRETRCVQIPGDSYQGCYWTPQSALEERP